VKMQKFIPTIGSPYGLAVLIVAFGLTISAAETAPVFIPRDYPSAKYKVTQASHELNDVSIRVIQVKKLKPDGTAPSYCRAWIEVKKGDTLLRRIRYADLEPVGFSYGVFAPSKQPSPDYVVLVKEGDYDGRLLLVSREGAVTDLLGGFFFLTADKRFLVSEYSSDSSGVAVYDLRDHRLIFQSKEIPYIQEWYKDDSGYFFTESEWSKGDSVPHERRDTIYRLDMKGGRVVKASIDPKRLQSATRVGFDFDPRQLEDCTSR